MLIITFQAQLVMVVRNPKGEVVEGDPVSAEQDGAGRRHRLSPRSVCGHPAGTPAQSPEALGLGGDAEKPLGQSLGLREVGDQQTCLFFFF